MDLSQNNKRRSIDSGDDGGSNRKRRKWCAETSVDIVVKGSGADCGSANHNDSEAQSLVAAPSAISTVNIPVILADDASQSKEPQEQGSVNLITVAVGEQQSSDLRLIDEHIIEDRANVNQAAEAGESVEPTAEPQPFQFADLNEHCVLELLARCNINDLASFAHTNKVLKEQAKSVFTHIHDGRLALKYVDGEEAAFRRTMETFGPLAKSMSITGSNDEHHDQFNIALLAAADVMKDKKNWNIQSIELKMVRVDFDLMTKTDQLKALSLFTNVNKLTITECQFLHSQLLFVYLKHNLTELSLDDCDLDYGIFNQYPKLTSLEMRFMGEYCDDHVEFQRDLFRYLLLPNFFIERLVLMSSHFGRRELETLQLLPLLNELTLNIEEEMDLLPLSRIPVLKSLTLFGNEEVNAGPLMAAFNNDHASITAVHLNNIKNGSEFCAKTTIDFGH